MNTEHRINSFSYSYNNSFGEGSYSVEITRTESGIRLGYSEWWQKEYEPVAMEEASLAQLEKLCDEKEIIKWDGYHEVDRDCLDGDGFSLQISYEGQKMSASGSNRVPSGYQDFITEMSKILDLYISDIKETARLEYIKTEHEAPMDSFMLSFSNSVYPKDHDIFFRAYRLDGVTTLEYRITLTNDDIYPKGEYRFYGDVDSDVVDFEKMDRIVTEYGLNKYHDLSQYEEGGQRYQIDYSYGDELYIDFSGTKPFEHYEEVRQEIYDFIFDVVEATK